MRIPLNSNTARRFVDSWPIPAALSLLLVGTLLGGCDTDADRNAPQQASDNPSGKRATQMSDISTNQAREGWSERKKFFVHVTPDPNPIPFQELFELDIRVFESKDAESRVENVSIDDIRAIMPAHDHGMKVAPAIEKTGPGSFTVQGMRWHMKGPGEDGHWRLELVLNAGSTIDTAIFHFQCCRPSSQ